jgi:hypothetical protein
MGRRHGRRAGRHLRQMSKMHAWLPGVMAMLPLVPVYGAQPAPPDAELLEFLGSIDSDEEGWQEFLEQMPLKPARAPAKPVAKPVPKPVAKAPSPAAVPGTEAKAAEDAGKVKSQ